MDRICHFFVICESDFFEYDFAYHCKKESSKLKTHLEMRLDRHGNFVGLTVDFIAVFE